jgi:hypothetical protein
LPGPFARINGPKFKNALAETLKLEHCETCQLVTFSKVLVGACSKLEVEHQPEYHVLACSEPTWLTLLV